MKQPDQYYELSYYTLSHPDQDFFIHQLIVDAHTAQTADSGTKSIALVFALVGLYLTVEKNYTGKQAQQAHILLSKKKKVFPKIALPDERGEITISDVLEKKTNQETDDMIKKWCASVWNAYKNNHTTIIQYCEENLY